MLALIAPSDTMVRILKLTSGENHPDAVQPILRYPRNVLRDIKCSTIINGSYLSILSYNRMLLVWDWRTGVIVYVSCFFAKV